PRRPGRLRRRAAAPRRGHRWWCPRRSPAAFPRGAGRSRGRCAACRGSPAYPRTRIRSLAVLFFINDLGVDDVLVVAAGALLAAGTGLTRTTRGVGALCLLLAVQGLADLLAGGGQLVLRGLDRFDVLA